MFNTTDVPKSSRIPKLVEALYANMPVIESARAKLLTESYKATEGEPMVTRRAEAFAHILRNIPIIIRDNELIVGSSTIAPRGCQTFPEFSFQWLEDELDTVETRSADPFYIAEETKQELREVHKYWKGKTSSELATSYMDPEAIKAIEVGIDTVAELKEKGYKLAICSNASKWELDVILRKLEVNDYFDVIQGVTEKNNKKYSLEELLLREKPELAVMVGDRSYDKEAARYNQIPFVGCKYGYGKPEELSDCKYSVETALELSRIIDEIISARGGAD